jgi:hypothetical protein
MNRLIQLTTRMRKPLYPGWILAAALTFTGCAVGPKYKDTRSSGSARIQGDGELENRATE